MKTLVLRIPDDLANELEAESKRTRLTKSEVARRRLMAPGSKGHETTGGLTSSRIWSGLSRAAPPT